MVQFSLIENNVIFSRPSIMLESLAELVVILLFLILVYVGWKSTEVRDTQVPISSSLQRHSLGRDVAIVPGSLFGLRNRRNRRGLPTRLLNESVEEIEYNSGNILMTHVLSWASNESISTGTNTEGGTADYLVDELDEGPEAIIRAMDMDRDVVPPTAARGVSPPDNDRATETAAAGNTEEVQNCTNENNENGSKQAEEVTSAETPTAESTPPPAPAVNEEAWKIKIKYLNDDMKVAEAKPSQTLKEFKKQNFETELAANKLVRLVFNGKVLQPDGASLKSCGLFDNCVVHCLVHNMPASHNSSSSIVSGREPQGTGPTVASPPSLTGQPGLQLIRRTIQNDVMAQGAIGGPPDGDQTAQDEAQANYSAAHLMVNRTQQFLIDQWTRLYSWRFFTEVLLMAFTIITIYLR